MFASLLPGLRELRTPLAVGYLWLLALWLLVRPSIPTRSEADGLWQAVYELSALLGTVAVLGGVSFAAYLVGCLLSMHLWGPKRLMTRAVAASARVSVLRQYAGHLYERDFTFATRTELVRHVEEELDRLEIDIRAVEEKDALAILGPSGTSLASRSEFAHALVGAVRRELPSLATQLEVRSEALFQSYDRRRAEADFRQSVATPLVAVVIVAAIIGSQPLLLLLLVPVVVLAYQGVVRARQADGALIELLIQGVIEAPTLRKLGPIADRQKAEW